MADVPNPALPPGAIRPTELLTVVRTATNDPTLEVLDWEVHTLSTAGAVNPDGLLRVDGHGRGIGGSQRWEVALKRINNSGPDVGPADLGYWRRESQAYGSGMLAGLPGPVQAVPCYGVYEHPDCAHIWMKVLTGRNGRAWMLADYVLAAEQIGCFNGACLLSGPSLEAPWLTRNQGRRWHTLMGGGAAWDNQPAVEVFPPAMQRGLAQLWSERERFYAAMDRMAHMFIHGDYKSRNLFIEPAQHGGEEVIAVDWGDCGLGALGYDVGQLAGGSAFMIDWEPERLDELEAVVFPAYLRGLGDAGWQGDETSVRLAYAVWNVVYFAHAMVALATFTLEPANREWGLRVSGVPAERYLAALPAYADHVIGQGDVARRLLERQGN